MKNRGKNKKKQWKRILKDIVTELHDAAKHRELTAAGFVVKKENEIKIVKGDKEAAKDHPEIPTAGSFVGREEMKAEAMVNPRAVRKQKKKRPKLTQAQLEALHVKSKAKGRKPTAKELAKQMHTDLENIPKLVKEIRKEVRQQEVRRQRRQLRAAMRKHEKAPKFPTSFQLPSELAPSLRQLKTDGAWMREVEFKRNKLPRARKTLEKKAETTTYVRRSRRT
ncbi:unnamed protein product [Taenia asiatica]|uniref:Ribosome biogenesis protein NOP53 n=1 Tax=Taenia asiatica TaxID=60517 RepID=A0A158R804_TAEAS|nr:unnamed protein product [Taenia asiatica]